MKQYVILIAECILSSISVFAQNTKREEMECLYRLSFLKEITSTVTTDDLMVLRFNKDSKKIYFLHFIWYFAEYRNNL